MDNLLLEFVKQAPYIAALIILVYMFQRNEEKREQQRVENAKAIEQERQAQVRELNNMWANSIKQIVDQHAQASLAIMTALREHEESSKERYKRLGITQDLLDAATERRKTR
jgi:hypothetical protein